jgi:hypothetical protein
MRVKKFLRFFLAPSMGLTYERSTINMKLL